MTFNPLAYEERSAQGEAQGLLILHHGRGSNEHDLMGLADALDPNARLHIVAPRGPLQLPGWRGYHWYVVPQVGYPDTTTFAAAYSSLAEFHDSLWQRTGLTPQQTILGGFSMGSVMSHSLGFGSERPKPAGVLAFSGFIPVVDGWDLAADAGGCQAFISHGAHDEIMNVEFGRSATKQLRAIGAEVEYHESDAGHHIDPTHVPLAQRWIAGALAARA